MTDRHRCPTCDTETTYAAFSGGREYYCPTCEDNGFYPDDMPNPPRAVLLQTEDGQKLLRMEMEEHLAGRGLGETPQ